MNILLVLLTILAGFTADVQSGDCLSYLAGTSLWTACLVGNPDFTPQACEVQVYQGGRESVGDMTYSGRVVIAQGQHSAETFEGIAILPAIDCLVVGDEQSVSAQLSSIVKERYHYVFLPVVLP